MLVLPYPDSLGIELHQFGQRIHKPPTNRYRSAHSHILVRELLPRHGRGGIDRSATFVDHDHGNRPRQAEPINKRLCLPSCRAVANGNRFYGKPLTQLDDLCPCYASPLLTLMGVDGGGVQQSSLSAQTHDLTAGPKARVNGEDVLLSQRGRE